MAATGAIAVRGKPKAAIGRRAIYDDPDKGPAGLDVVPRRWCAFDWDGLPLELATLPKSALVMGAAPAARAMGRRADRAAAPAAGLSQRIAASGR